MRKGSARCLPLPRWTFFEASWRTTIETARASKDPKDRRRAKRLWELGLAEQMRKLLRSSDLSVPGSRQHKVWTSYLHSETAWAERKSSWFVRHPGHQDANAYLDALEERYQTTLQSVLAGWDTNDFAQIVMKDGKATLDLSKDEKPVLPATVEPLRAAMLVLMPYTRLADVFLEVEDWTGFREDFPHLNERQQAAKRDPRTDLALFAAILAHGLNLPLTTVSIRWPASRITGS